MLHYAPHSKESVTYTYRYLDTETGKALVRCPKCNGNLTANGGINIELTDDYHVWEVPDRLRDDGHLTDAGDQVAMGPSSATRCGHCSEMLINMRGIAEQDISTKR